MKRNKHSLSHYKLSTMDMGQIYPCACFEVLPGDSVQQHTSALVRCSPLLAPVMHPMSVRIHHWFVPYRLLWNQWENFITGGTDGQGDGSVFPTVNLSSVSVGDLPDYFGIPPGAGPFSVSALPFRAYNLIFNEYYRDQDLLGPVVTSVAGGVDSTTAIGLQRIAWEKDYFTSARPWPQKGPDVTLPMGTRAPVKGINVSTAVPNDASVSVGIDATGETHPIGTYGWKSDLGNFGILDAVNASGTAGTGGHLPDVYADLSVATAANINDVRRAFAIQRYQEARAMYGSRYTEYLRYLGVRSSDARLQRPEYLGGGKQTISFSEVLRTGSVDDTAPAVVGEMKGHGIAAMRSRPYRRFFEEHGVVISLFSVRPRTMYVQGVHRQWLRRAKEDFWQRELEHIGQQEVFNNEVYAQSGAAGEGTFGYQDRYSEYRHHPSSIASEFRTTLNFWHLARDFGAPPTLNNSFVACNPGKRIFAEQTAKSLWVMLNHSIRARRMVSRSTVGRVI